MRFLCSRAGKKLWDTFEDYKNWTIGEYIASYKNKIHLWIPNGPDFFDGKPSLGTPKFLGWFERRILWNRFKRIVEKRLDNA